MGQVWLHYCKLRECCVNGIRQPHILLLVREVRATLLKKKKQTTHQEKYPSH